MKKRNLALAMTAVMGMSVLTACGGSSSPAPAATTAATATEAAKAETQAAAPASGTTRVLKLAGTIGSESPLCKELNNFAARVNELTNGSISVEIYPASQLGGQDEIMEGIGMGTIEMSFLPPGVCEGFFPKVGIPGTLFLVKDEEHILKIWESEYGQNILNEMAETINVRCLDQALVGTRNIWTVTPVNKLEDLNGIKLRVPGAPSFVNVFGALGTNPTPMALGEVYTGLQTKVIEGLEMDTRTIMDYNMQELCKYCYKTSHAVTSNAFMIANNLWNELTEEERTAMRTAMKESCEVLNNQYYADRDALEQELTEKYGVTFVTPSAEDLAKIDELLYSVTEENLGGLATMDDLAALKALAD